jgi:alanyl-tRNA synthetase
MTSRQIRQDYLDFFAEKGHTIVPSAPVIPHDDPTLMFTNAGMNQFKDVFLGVGERPYVRVADSQKCIRVSGKHNDLEEVGPSPYHHTFFEMLGNWSFGDYFKKEAIAWAWELLVDRWGLPGERLWATYFGGDVEDKLEPDSDSARLWPEVTGVPQERVVACDKSDNFWEMGATGPCGVNSEVHIDLGEKRGCLHRCECGVNAEDEWGKCYRFVEIWNLVFIQFNRSPDGILAPLPASHVDTGMGFERMVKVLQGKRSNYDTDVFMPLIDAISEISGIAYEGHVGGPVDTAFRVVADHLRTLSFAVTDGCLPSNDGRGYVLRRLLRRAARFGRQQLQMKEPFIHRLVTVLAESMGDAYPELVEHPERVVDVIKDEEESFGRTIDRGVRLFESAASDAESEKRSISGEAAFRLYDESGFPLDLTVLMAREKDVDVDVEAFDRIMEEKRRQARERAKASAKIEFTGTLPACDDSLKYSGFESTAKALGWIQDGKFIDKGSLNGNEGETALVIDRTCFYPEAGGQVGDTGVMTTATGTFEVDDTQRLGDAVIHIGKVTDGHIEAGQTTKLDVDPRRLDTMRNHTSTHLLHWALRQVLGDHVKQRGSLVDSLRLRFDFDHNRPVSREQLQEAERLVNQEIFADHEVIWREMPIEEGRQAGAMALFGEKYGDIVRVVSIGADDQSELSTAISIEFCGGTHLSRTGQAGYLKIVAEEGVAKGVRRISAVTGPAAVNYIQSMDRSILDLADRLRIGRDQLVQRVEAMRDEIKTLKDQLQKGGAGDLKTTLQQLLSEAEPFTEAGVLIVAEVPDVPVEQIRSGLDWLRQKSGSAAVFVACRGDEKVVLFAAVTQDLIDAGLRAGDWVKEVAPIVDGRGGGRPNMAQAGGKNPERLPDALDRAKTFAHESIG